MSFFSPLFTPFALHLVDLVPFSPDLHLFLYHSDKIIKEVPTYRVISQSTLIDRMKINGSLARRAIAHLEKEGLIKRVVHHHAQLVYTRATAGKD